MELREGKHTAYTAQRIEEGKSFNAKNSFNSRYAPIHDLPLISTPSRQSKANPYLKQVLYSVTPCHPATQPYPCRECMYLISVCMSYKKYASPLLALPLIEVSRAESGWEFNSRG
jgi:hypothetical protein